MNINTQTINQIVDDFMYAYASNIIDSGHNASGKLITDMKKLLSWNGRFFTVSLSLPPYWKYLENGTKPHFPPINAILKWIKVKPILPREFNGKLPTQKQLAYMIANKIDKVGTQPTQLLQKTKTDFNVVGKIYDAFVQAYNDYLNKEMDI